MSRVNLNIVEKSSNDILQHHIINIDEKFLEDIRTLGDGDDIIACNGISYKYKGWFYDEDDRLLKFYVEKLKPSLSIAFYENTFLYARVRKT